MQILNAITPVYSNVTWAGKYAYIYNAGKNDIYLKMAIIVYLENLQNSCAPNTLYCYSRDLNVLLEQIGNIKMSIISEDTLNNFITQVCCSGKKCGTTLNRIKSAYRSFFNYCYKREYVNINLADEIHLIKSCSRFTTAITQKEIISLLGAISQSTDTFSKRDKALFAVYAFTGVRKTEALALRISDYDRDSKLLHLPFVKRCSKKFQTVPSILSNILEDYLASIGNSDSSLPLFSGVNINSYLSGRQVSYRFEKWKIVSGIKKNLTIHSFRAFYALQLYKKTNDPLLVSYALGHSSFNTTKRYISEDIFDLRSILESAFCIETKV